MSYIGMKSVFNAVFGDSGHYSEELFCFRSLCTVHEDETQLSTSNNDIVGHGSIIEEGQRNTNHVDSDEVVESDSVSASLGGYESPDHCRLRQNLQSKSNGN
jgi:hypothetical protein